MPFKYPLPFGFTFFAVPVFYDALFVSSQDSKSALGQLTGRIHLAFQAKNEEQVKAFYNAALEAGGKALANPALGLIIPDILQPLF